MFERFRLGVFLCLAGFPWLTAAARVHPLSAPTVRHRPGPSQAAQKLRPCQANGVTGEVLCGTYEVYENREARSGRKISLNILVLRASSPSPASDPLFVFAGGPGQAAIDGAPGYAQIFAPLRGTRDIVLIDQRGTGRSNPLNCELGDLNEIVQALFAGSLPAEGLRACRRRLEQKADLRFYTTPVAVDDIDEVRAWLGYERINIYGSSYGSRAALVYLKRHPRHVRAVVIKAVAPENYKNPLYNPRDAQSSLDRLIADCARDAACAKAFPDLGLDVRKVLDGLANSPVSIRVPDAAGGAATEVVITRDVFAGALRRALMDPNAQRGIPATVQKALAGDFKNFAAFLAPFRTVAKSFSLGMNLSVICAEDVPVISAREVERETGGTFLGGKLVRGLIKVCREWPRGKLPKNFYAPTRSDLPVLIISGRLDPDTPPEWGQEVGKHLPNSLHLVLEGMSHLSPPACAWEIINQFISSGSAKGLDTSCVVKSQRPPFIIP